MYSLGEPYYSETMLPIGYKTVIDWFQEVASTPDYMNPQLERIDIDAENEREQQLSWDGVDGATGFVEPEKGSENGV